MPPLLFSSPSSRPLLLAHCSFAAPRFFAAHRPTIETHFLYLLHPSTLLFTYIFLGSQDVNAGLIFLSSLGLSSVHNPYFKFGGGRRNFCLSSSPGG
ncbi:unnamed protein product [Cuscuta campestris]|uniref:Uncharacterized protein n=1 Tax=Cuscuta campestris TaxID=132261 RepID=A0A484MM41_9ASTE|nr:unnamed protein product [Cuscuta campestris]